MLCGIPHAMAREDLEAIDASASLVPRLLGRASHEDIKQLLVFHPTEEVEGRYHSHEAAKDQDEDPTADAKARRAINMAFHRHVVGQACSERPVDGFCSYDT